MKMSHETDAAKSLRESVGDIDHIDVLHNCVLVATYIRPVKTAGGIMLPDQVLKEDEYQGKVGLVLKKGPLAFEDDAINKFGGSDVSEDEWVAYRMSDGWQLKVNGVHCRVLEDVHIK